MAAAEGNGEAFDKTTLSQTPAGPYGTFESEQDELVDRDTSMQQVVSQRQIRMYFVEFLGCVIFIFIGSLTGLNGSITGIAFGHGLTIAILIMAFGHISGGHFNPAVTLGVLISGNIHIFSAAAYVVAQLLGGFVGSLLVRGVLGDVSYNAITGGATIVPADTTWARAIVCEIILTYILVNSVLMTAVDTDSNVLAPLAIGLSITLDIFAAGGISGASMNPARSLGPCISASLFADHSKITVTDIWSHHYVYWIGPILGASIAALLYKLFLAKDERRILL